MSNENDGDFELLRSTAEASPLAIAVSEGPAHRLRYVNAAFCRLYARPAAELMGRPFAEACPEEVAPAACHLLDRVFETGTAESLADLRRAGSETQAAYWSFAVWPLPDRSGVATQVTDTTGLHLAFEAREGELQKVNQQLLLAALREDERSDALRLADRTKDEFLAMLAHELRNPLAAIRSGIYLLAERANADDEAARETCALLERQMRHLSRLLDDLLDVSRITRGKVELRLEPTDVAQSLNHAVAATRSLLELNSHRLSLALPSEPVWVDADPVRLEQVVTNLLQNSIKYMAPGGQVWLSLEKVPFETEGSPSPPFGTALVRVRDTGIGISPEALTHIFDLFVQADPSGTGTKSGLGIGLTLSKSLIELHGGSVEALSAGLGCGSEFRVLLPLREPGAAGDPTDPDAEPTPTVNAGTVVLLVEDNVSAATTLAEVLELWGYDVKCAVSGDVALATAAAARPAIVLLDIGLPDMDGYEVARRLRTNVGLHEALLVALTGYAQESDRQRSREAGIDHHLSKPVDLEALRRMMASRPRRVPLPPC